MIDVGHFYQGKTVVVTGSGGYLASALIQELQRTAARVVAVSRRDLGPVGRAERLRADVGTIDCWTAIVGMADIIFHLAGNTSVRAAASDAAASLQSTVVPLIHLAAAARVAGRRPRVVFASTATVYGLTGQLPVDEGATAQPVTTYDLHKLIAEQHLALASSQGTLDAVSLRLANVYGPSPGFSFAPERGVLNQVADQAVRGVDLRIFGDGNYLRDYVYISDVTRAFMLAGAHPQPAGRLFNVGSGTGTTVRDAFHLVAERAERISGKRSLVRQTAWPEDTDPIERRHFTANIARIASALNWRPAVSLAEGIGQLVDHLGSAMSPDRPGGHGPGHAEGDGPLRLNLGCGGRPRAGYVNVDRDSRDRLRSRYPGRPFADDLVIVDYDIFHLPYPDNAVDEVRADALIEHLPFADEQRFFTEAVRVLRPGGVLFITTVDFETVVRQWLAAKDDWQDFYRTDDEAIRSQHWFGTHSYAADNRWGYLTATLFGSQNGAGQFHTNCYSEAKLRAICERMHLDVDAVERCRWQGDRDHMLALSARKRR